MRRAPRAVLAAGLGILGSACQSLAPHLSLHSRPAMLNEKARAASAAVGSLPIGVVTTPGTVSPGVQLRIPRLVMRALGARPPLRLTAGHLSRLHIDVALAARTLALVDGTDTLLKTPIAVASGLTLYYAGRTWTFRTPRGERRVLRKAANPVWTPPDWHYAETAADYGLKLVRLSVSGAAISRGRRLAVRDGVVGIVYPGERFRALPRDEHIVFDGQLFIPPFGTVNRRVTGELGPFALDLGDGYMIHGSPDSTAIGEARTHGCIRVGDDDLAWLYENVPVGIAVRVH